MSALSLFCILCPRPTPPLIFTVQATHTSSSGASRAVKNIQKNFNSYASVECGAKILGANPEAKV